MYLDGSLTLRRFSTLVFLKRHHVKTISKIHLIKKIIQGNFIFIITHGLVSIHWVKLHGTELMDALPNLYQTSDEFRRRIFETLVKMTWAKNRLTEILNQVENIPSNHDEIK